MTTPEIHIYGPHSILKGEYPVAVVRAATSYPVEGAEFSKAYRKGLWDGRTHLFNKKTGSFPTGLVSTVRTVLSQTLGTDIAVIDHREEPEPQGRSFDLVGVKMEGKYSYQLDACKTMVKQKQGVVKISTNGGKCLGKDTPVLMFDGTIRRVQDVVVGDLLMGPDSKPRRVLSTTSNVGPMYRIVPNKGDSWTCNDVHVLTLVHTVTGAIIDIPLNEYLSKTVTFKHKYKLFSVGVDFPDRPVSVDPYFLGLWYGDGTKRTRGTDLTHVAITNLDPEILSFIRDFAHINSLRVSDYTYGSRCPTLAIVGMSNSTNTLLDTMRTLVGDLSRLPAEYLVNSRQVRLQFLAGLVDSDGYHHDGCFEIVQKRKDWAEDICFLARSLGFRALLSKKTINEVDYWRISIVGDLSCVPTRLPRKQAPPRKHKWNPLRTGFSVESIGSDEYYGFMLDGDGRFLLGDFTVTHNTEISCAVTKYLGLQTLFLVSTQELLYQARERFKKRLGLTDQEVGIIGDGEWSPGSWVTIAMIPTLEARIDTDVCQEFLKSIDVLFIDEAHHAGSETWYTVCSLCPAYYRFGLSGTPMDRTDGANLRLLATTGDVIVNISNKYLVENGISARAEIIFDKITEPVLDKKKKFAYPTVYKQVISENPVHLKKVVDWTKIFVELGLGTLILVEEIQHGKMIDDALWTQAGDMFIPHMYIHGSAESEERQKALADFAVGNLPVLISSKILDEGVDVPTIDALILAGSRKSRIKTMQRLGRGLRGKKLIVVEFANYCHKYTIEHSLERLEDYKKEECFDIHTSGPDIELVRRLWNKDGTNG